MPHTCNLSYLFLFPLFVHCIFVGARCASILVEDIHWLRLLYFKWNVRMDLSICIARFFIGLSFHFFFLVDWSVVWVRVIVWVWRLVSLQIGSFVKYQGILVSCRVSTKLVNRSSFKRIPKLFHFKSSFKKVWNWEREKLSDQWMKCRFMFEQSVFVVN